MSLKPSLFGVVALTLVALLSAGCSDNGSGQVLYVDAEFDPPTTADTFTGVNEASPAVAQTFTVLATGRFEEFWIVINDGPSADSGIVRLTVRPVNAMGEPDPDESTSIIRAIDVDTSTLPGTLVEEFSEFFVGDDPRRNVQAGEVYAIVVEFISRTTSNDTLEIATLLGQAGDPYADGSGATGQSGVGFTLNNNDYFFRTFSLR